MKNKKSQLGATLTWFVAIFIIFFIMLMFVIIVALMNGSKWFSSFNNEGDVRKYDIDNAVFNNFLSFLNTPLEFNGRKTIYLDVISSSLESKDREQLNILIKKELDNYCSKYALLIPNSLIFGKLEDSSAGISIFSNNVMGDFDWTPTLRYKITYNGEKFELLYRQLKSCGGEEIKNE